MIRKRYATATFEKFGKCVQSTDAYLYFTLPYCIISSSSLLIRFIFFRISIFCSVNTYAILLGNKKYPFKQSFWVRTMTPPFPFLHPLKWMDKLHYCNEYRYIGILEGGIFEESEYGHYPASLSPSKWWPAGAAAAAVKNLKLMVFRILP